MVQPNNVAHFEFVNSVSLLSRSVVTPLRDPYRDLDEAGALLTVGTYANPDYWTYWRTQRVLAWTGGMLVLGGIT